MTATEPTIDQRQARLRICIATITRRRPRMLRRLIASWESLLVPENCDCLFVIVENDSQSQVVAPTAIMSEQGGEHELVYRLEPRQGIPFARNCAANIALENAADLLLFIDDDEVASQDWAANLVKAYRDTGAHLIGGPVRLAPPAQELSFLERMVFEGIRCRMLRSEKRTALRLREANIDAITIVTNNWLASVELFRERGLQFDEKLNLSGGSDAKFSREVKKMGLRRSWAPEAVVYEFLPSERLTYLYQFRRGRDQSNASLRRNIEISNFAYATILFSVPTRLLGIIVLLVFMPFFFANNSVAIARNLGWVCGRVSVLFGGVSTHYKVTTGA